MSRRRYVALNVVLCGPAFTVGLPFSLLFAILLSFDYPRMMPLTGAIPGPPRA